MTGKIKDSERTPTQWWELLLNTYRLFEKAFLKEGEAAFELYEFGKGAEGSAASSTSLVTTSSSSVGEYNILYANTETLRPALLNRLPQPEVKVRPSHAENPVAKAARGVVENLLRYYLDDGGQSSPLEVVDGVITQGLVAGRGGLRFSVEDDGVNGAWPVAKELQARCVLHDPAATYDRISWVAYLWDFTRQELKDKLGVTEAQLATLAAESEGFGQDISDEEKAVRETFLVAEVWCKTTKQIHWMLRGLGEVIKTVPDPYKLSSFYPQPPFLQFFTTKKGLPRPLYSFYEKQAEELNDISFRIKRLVRALRIRGGYTSGIEGLGDILKAADNEMVEVKGLPGGQAGQSSNLSNHVWVVPIDEIIQALPQLYRQRAEVKAVIFEITGVADIMRGSSVASETLGAQKLKNEWGSLRLKRAQRQVSDFIVNSLRLAVELMLEFGDSDTLRRASQSTLPTQEQVQMQALQQQQAGQPGQPAPAAPAPITWEQAIEFLRQEKLAFAAIDIETNSSVDVEATEDKAAVGELLNAVAQFMNGIGPLIEKGQMPQEAGIGLLKGLVRRYRMGDQVEAALDAMVSKKPEGPPPPDPKAQAEAAKAQFEMQAMKQTAELQVQEHQLKMQELQMRAQESALEHQVRMTELQRRAAQPGQ